MKKIVFHYFETDFTSIFHKKNRVFSVNLANGQVKDLPV